MVGTYESFTDKKKTVYKKNDGGANMAQKGVSLIKAAFDTDNFLMRFSEKVLDIVTANLLFVVSCLPIVTIGVAKISLYETMFEVKKSRRVPVFKIYLRSFKQNLKLGLQLGLMELGIVFLTLSDLYLSGVKQLCPSNC